MQLDTQTQHLHGEHVDIGTNLARIETLPYGVVLASDKGRVQYANPAAWRLLGKATAHTSPTPDLHTLNFTAAWSAIKNALPGLRMVRDNHLTICYMDRLKQFGELTVCLAGLDAGPNRHLLILSQREADADASSADRHRDYLQSFAADCKQKALPNGPALGEKILAEELKA